MIRLIPEATPAGEILLLVGTNYEDRFRCAAIGGGHWDRTRKSWVFPPSAKEKIENEFPETTINQAFNFDYNGPIPNLNLITKPYQHQVRGAAFILHRFSKQYEGCCLLDEMGLGKSKEVIDAFINMGPENSVLIIVCPNTVLYNWANELQTHGHIEDITIFTGTKAKRNRLIHEPRSRKSAIITTYGILRSEYQCTKKGKSSKLINMINRSSILVADEAHYIKNEQSGRSKAFAMCSPRFRIMLTGTPVANIASDLYHLMILCDRRLYKSREHFDYLHVIHKLVETEEENSSGKIVKKSYKLIVGFKNLDLLRQNLASCSIRRLKETSLDLPPKIFEIRNVFLGKRQAEAYTKMKSELRYLFSNMTEQEFHKQKATVTSKILRLQQITSGILSDGTHGEWLECTKDECIDDLLEEVDQLVIWVMFRPTALRLAKKYKASIVIGKQTNEERQAQIDAFKAGKNRLLVGTTAAGGIGINLTNACCQAFYDIPYTPAQYSQAIDRLHRIGQTKSVNILNFIAKDTIDEKRYRNLMRKIGESELITSPTGISSLKEAMDLLD